MGFDLMGKGGIGLEYLVSLLMLQLGWVRGGLRYRGMLLVCG